jgi:hypothetical protein
MPRAERDHRAGERDGAVEWRRRKPDFAASADAACGSIITAVSLGASALGSAS